MCPDTCHLGFRTVQSREGAPFGYFPPNSLIAIETQEFLKGVSG
jgi:hypothetical protein